MALPLLAACGGGGGGGGSSGSGGSPTATLTVTPGSVTVAGVTSEGIAPSASISLSVANASAAGTYIGWQYTQSGIESADLQQTTDSSGTIALVFKNPSLLGPGTYKDTVQVGICTDSGCTDVTSASLHTISVTYTVTGPAMSVSASPTTLDVQALPFLDVPPSAPVTLNLQGVPKSMVTVTLANSSNGIAGAGVDNDGVNYIVSPTFKVPSQLAPGTYDDTMTIDVCMDTKCPSPLPGSPITVTVHYTVSATVGGVNGYTARAVSAITADMVSDAVGGKIYLSIPAAAATSPNSLVALDPVAGTLGTAISAPNDPGAEAVSDDGSYLYVASHAASAVDRYTLPALAHNLTIPMGTGSTGALFADDIQVAPGLPHSLAVVRNTGPFTFTYDVSVFDDAVQRTNVLAGIGASRTGVSSNRLQWSASASTLYGVDGTSSLFPIQTYAVDASGLALLASAPVEFSQYAFGRLHLGGTSLFGDDGQAFTTTPAVSRIGRYAVDPANYPKASVPDAANNRVFLAFVGGSDTTVQSYDLTTFAPIARISLPGISLVQQPRLLRWGADGLALQAADKVILINGAFVKP